MTSTALRIPDDSHSDVKPPVALTVAPTRSQMINAWIPWVILCVVVAIWATDTFKHIVDPWFSPVFPLPGVDKIIAAVKQVMA